MSVTIVVIQGVTTLLAFFLGAYVYYQGQTDRSPLSLNLNKKEKTQEVDWDQI